MIRVSSLFKDSDNTRNKTVMVDSSWHKGLTNVGKEGWVKPNARRSGWLL